MYGVETKRINEAVKNNLDRFPVGYIIEVNKDTKNELVENFDRFKTLKHSTSLPKAFTEKGIYMLATILTTKKAIQSTIDIIEIESDMTKSAEDGEIVETTTKFEFNLGFAKISKSIKKIKK